jgi:hypothetical protein
MYAIIVIEEEGLEKYLVVISWNLFQKDQGGGQERDLTVISWNLFQKDQGADQERIRCQLQNLKIHPKTVKVRISFFLIPFLLQVLFQMTFHWLMSCQLRSLCNQLLIKEVEGDLRKTQVTN